MKYSYVAASLLAATVSVHAQQPSPSAAPLVSAGNEKGLIAGASSGWNDLIGALGKDLKADAPELEKAAAAGAKAAAHARRSEQEGERKEHHKGEHKGEHHKGEHKGKEHHKTRSHAKDFKHHATKTVARRDPEPTGESWEEKIKSTLR